MSTLNMPISIVPISTCPYFDHASTPTWIPRPKGVSWVPEHGDGVNISGAQKRKVDV